MKSYRIGAHVSISKGLSGALEKAQVIGANCIQIFSSPPLSYTTPDFDTSECRKFREKAAELDITPVFIHAPYLINLASGDERIRAASNRSLIADLRFAAEIGAKGVIVHTGSHKGKGLSLALTLVADLIKEILSSTSIHTKLYLEVASGGKGKIGSTFADLQLILTEIESPRLGICLDTAHLYAAGYKLDTVDGLDKLVHQIEKTVGWGTVGCLHANDSKVPFGSGRDKHENIGEGYIGKETFWLLLHHPTFNQLPFIIETPGFADQGSDKRNLDILKSLI